MIKTMCCLGSATLGVLLLSACGSNVPLTVDKSVLSTGVDNAISTGGYWWTYTDHNDSTSAYHATTSQVTTLLVGLQTTVDSDANHGKVVYVTGKVPPALPWGTAAAPGVSTQADFTIDKHWESIYPDARVPAYPATGLGFGFQKDNKPFDATQGGKYVGVAFDMKVGLAGMNTVWNSYPIVGTDLPDPNFSDAFPAPGAVGGCTYYTTSNTPVTGYQTCFTNYRKGYVENGGTSYTSLAAPGTWKRYCTLFAEVGVPNWANTGTIANVPAFDPTHVLKMQWDMFQPAATDTAAVEYAVSVDNVQLVTATQAAETTNNCDPAGITALPGSIAGES